MSPADPSPQPRPTQRPPLLDKHGNPPPPRRARPGGNGSIPPAPTNLSAAAVDEPLAEAFSDEVSNLPDPNVSAPTARPGRPPVLDKHGNPPPPARGRTAPPAPASIKEPAPPQPRRIPPAPSALREQVEETPPRRPRPPPAPAPEPVRRSAPVAQPEPVVQRAPVAPRRRPAPAAPRQREAADWRPSSASTADVSDRRSEPRPGRGRHQARALPRHDPATYQPVFVSQHVAKARAGAEWVMVIVTAVTVALLIKAYVVEAFEIPSRSMVPTLLVHDKVVVNKLAYKYGDIHRGDVVVFKSPPAEQAIDPTIHNLIKRVIGMPGDTLESRDGALYRNGELVDESYLPPGTITDTLPATTVGPGQLFMMGDNRGDSEDSRFFGTVDQNLVVGKAEIRAWPLPRLGML